MPTAEGGPGRSIGPLWAGVSATSPRGVRGIKGHNIASGPRVLFICSVFSPPRSFLPTHAVDCSYTGRTQMKKETHRRRSSPLGLAQAIGEEGNNKYTTTLGGQEQQQQQQQSGAYAPLIATSPLVGRLLVMVVVVDALLLLLRVPFARPRPVVSCSESELVVIPLIGGGRL